MDAIPQNDGIDMPFGGDSIDPSMSMPQPGQQFPQNNFEADFDAGVEANEEEDPKKFIQQLTGKLSQSLRKYNENLPQPDAELSKYVAGMILKQTIEGLPQEDVNDILEKAKTDDDDQLSQEQMPIQDNGIPPQPEQPNINETTASAINACDIQNNQKSSKIRKDGYSRKPYRTTV